MFCSPTVTTYDPNARPPEPAAPSVSARRGNVIEGQMASTLSQSGCRGPKKEFHRPIVVRDWHGRQMENEFHGDAGRMERVRRIDSIRRPVRPKGTLPAKLSQRGQERPSQDAAAHRARSTNFRDLHLRNSITPAMSDTSERPKHRPRRERSENEEQRKRRTGVTKESARAKKATPNRR